MTYPLDMDVADHTVRLTVKPPSIVRQLTRVCVAFGLFFALIVWPAAIGFLWVNESRLVFRADWSRQRLDAFDGDGFQSVRFATDDGLTLEGVTLSSEGNASPYWILFCPPAGSSIHWTRIQQQLLQLQALGYHVLAFDYRGFGRNPGAPSEAGIYSDAIAAYRYLTRHNRVSSSRIILAGRSLGSAVAVELATRLDAAGLLLFSPIDSVPLTAARIYPWAPVSFLAANQFDSSAKLRRVREPVLVVHATNDRLVPISAVRAMFQEIPGRKLMLETGGGHNRAGFAPGTDLKEAMGRFWPTPE